MYLNFTFSGHLYISPQDDCRAIVDAMLEIDYNEEFCIAGDFSPEFIARMMEAGFLVMSANLAEKDDEPYYILLPKLHLIRSVLFFENLHIKKSIRRLLDRYELRVNTDFDRIIDRCVEKHGGDWLTPPLVECIKKIRQSPPKAAAEGGARPACFAVYRDGKLAAGEFGIACGGIYTSYSGFYDEDNSGTVQLILTALYLQGHGFSFFDLGMPMNYKADLGAIDICPREFVRLFRDASC
jgi:Leu/Phe-tRNA-protein transferase